MKDLGEYTDEPHFSSLFAKMDFKNVGEVTYSDFEEVLSKEMKNDMGSSDSSERSVCCVNRRSLELFCCSAEKVLSRLKTMRREVNAELVHTRTSALSQVNIGATSLTCTISPRQILCAACESIPRHV
eukprot:750740-Hanusia_phi.AAC.2